MLASRVLSRGRGLTRGYGSRRGISSATAGHEPRALTLNLSHTASKRRVIDELAKQTFPRRPGQDALVVLASSSFGTWLEDSQFMSALLKAIGESSSGASRDSDPTASLNILAGVVPSLCPSQSLGAPSQGISILHGSLGELMPDLWQPVGLKAPRSPRSRDPELQSSITFQLDHGLRSQTPMDVTIPLANTTFVNNRQSTLLAMQWSRDSVGGFQLGTVAEKQTQRVALYEMPGSSSELAEIQVPLVPITPPRRVAAGWENIVRQIEVDDKDVPASQELEDMVNTIFAQQQKLSQEGEIKPIPVWALVIPPRASDILHLASERATEAATAVASEPSAALEQLAQRAIPPEWLADGCRLHRVLSGGGGWGAKRGLLSLDPETSYTLPSDDRVYAFERLLEQRMDGELPEEGIVTPGSYVQFYIAPQPAMLAGVELDRRYCFGTTPWGYSELPELNKPRYQDDVVFRKGIFGGLSSHGLFLRSAIDGGNGSSDVMTKLDSPSTYVCSGPRLVR